jgi:predicted nucleic acid-binding protein
VNEPDTRTRYCFDTNAWIDIFRRKFPRKTFVTLWQKVEQAVNDGEIVTVDAVVMELGKQEDDLSAWIKQQRDQIQGFIALSSDDIQRQATDLIRQYAVKSDADPFVAAAAKAHRLVVVSGEKRADYPREKPPKLPNLCEFLGVRCIGLLELFDEKNWTF